MLTGAFSRLALCLLASTANARIAIKEERSLHDGRPILKARADTSDPYAPTKITCPSGPLVRAADSLGEEEKSYIERRAPKASAALHQWLIDTWGCEYAEDRDLPVIAIAMSGGGPKAGLSDAGFMYGIDSRDESDSASGILQSATYISALSGGSLTLSGVFANDFERISSLKSSLWDINYQDPFKPIIGDFQQSVYDIDNKTAAGYTSTLVDYYGRAISLDFIQGLPLGGDGLLWSNVTQQASFNDAEAPFPIITVTNTDVAGNQCFPTNLSAIIEITPYEFGAWDEDFKAFFPTKYLGTTVDNGAAGECTLGFDNTGWIAATSSNILVSRGQNCTTGNFSTSSLTGIAATLGTAFGFSNVLENPYAIVANPFYNSNIAGSVSSQKDLYMVDGGYSGQGIPIQPFLQPERDIDVIFVVDTATNTANNITNGGATYQTYVQSRARGLTTMPVVPDPATFVAQNLSSRAQFYGCYDSSVRTVIYLPNTNETTTTSNTFSFTPEQINAVFYGGVAMADQYGNPDWGSCLACGIMHKSPWGLPDECDACLSKYCWMA